jgi:hypothetical protein
LAWRLRSDHSNVLGARQLHTYAAFSHPLYPSPCHPSCKPGMHSSLQTVHFSTLTARKHTDLLGINLSSRRSHHRSSRAIRIRGVVSCIPEIPRPGQFSSSRVRSARKVSTLTFAHSTHKPSFRSLIFGIVFSIITLDRSFGWECGFLMSLVNVSRLGRSASNLHLMSQLTTGS